MEIGLQDFFSRENCGYFSYRGQICEVMDVADQVRLVFRIIHPVYSGSSLLSEKLPAPVKIRFVEKPVEVAESMPLVDCCPVCYSLQ